VIEKCNALLWCTQAHEEIKAIKADVKARRPSQKASVHMVADRLVGSLFHCLSVAGNISMVKGWVVCPCTSKTLGYSSCGGYSVGGTGLW